MNSALNSTSAPRATAITHPAVQKALGVLLEGREYAQDLRTSPWEFAVEIAALLAEGCTPNTLRWLVRRGYVEHAVASAPGALPQPESQPDAGQEFSAETRFVLTESGATLARAGCPALGAEPAVPVWDSTHGELRFLGRLVRHFRNTASNQRAVLDAFEGQGWPAWLNDPLPRSDGQRINLKRRLHDTIKNLNRGHETRCLHFYGADAGRAVGWKQLT